MIKAAIAFAFLSTICSAASVQPYAFGAGAFPVAQGPTAIVSADFNRDGRPDLAVANENGVSVLLGKPDGSFATKVDYSFSTFAPTGLTVGDVNGDGKIDLIAVTPTEPTVWIMLGNGNGTFQAPTSISLPDVINTAGVVAGDFNKDGKLDLAIAAGTFSGGVVAILLGKGNGTFETEVDYPTTGSFSVITGDFNGDGKPDLAVGNAYVGGGGDTISILLGKGDGTFQSYIPVPVPGDGDDSLATADLNHDGKLDLVVASAYNLAGGVSVLLGNGNGTFAPAVSYPSPTVVSASNAVAIGDFNGDGKPDIAATNYDGYDVSVFIGVGDGTFKNAVNYPGSLYPVGLVTGDFNGDGRLDIASVAGYISSAAVTVLIGKGDGTFTTHVNHTVPIYPYDIATGDFNGDGKPDLVVDSFNTPGSVSVLLGKGNGSFTTYTDTYIGSHPSSLATGDFNRDGHLDVVVNAVDPKTGSELLSTLLGNGNGTFQVPLSQKLPSVPSNFAIADFNLDGKLDLATSMQLTTGVYVFLGKGDGTFAAPLFFDAGGDAGNNIGPVFTADLNSDHKPDLVVSTFNGISILLGEGNGSFQPYKTVLPGSSLVAVGDFNGDGKPDLVVFPSAGNFVGIALGKGDGTFSPPQKTVYTSTCCSHPLVGDFNGDGKLDIAGINSTDMTVSVLLGNGDGTFGPEIILPTENSPWSMTAADFTGSGGLDIAVAVAVLGSKGAVSVYPNHPVGALYPSSLRFGSQTIGTTSKALTTKLYNSGGTPLAISAITTTGAYAETHTCGARLVVGSSCTISITFKPTSTGTQLGSLSVKDTAAVKPQTIMLSGVGVK
jgi:hypothetical protein